MSGLRRRTYVSTVVAEQHASGLLMQWVHQPPDVYVVVVASRHNTSVPPHQDAANSGAHSMKFQLLRFLVSENVIEFPQTNDEVS